MNAAKRQESLLLHDSSARSRQSSHVQYSYLIAIGLTPNIRHLTINFYSAFYSRRITN